MNNNLTLINTLDDFMALESLKDRYLLIVSSLGRTQLSSGNLDEFLKKQGAKVDDKHPFICIIDGDTVICTVAEKPNETVADSCCLEGVDLDIVSLPNNPKRIETQGRSQVLINGTCVAMGERGIAIVLFDKKANKTVDSVTFFKPTSPYRMNEAAANLISSLSELHMGFGYTIAQWLCDFGYTEVSVIVEEEFADLARAVLLPLKFHDDINVKNVFTVGKKSPELKYTLHNFFPGEKISRFNERALSEGEIILHISPVSDPKLRQAAEKLSGEYFKAETLLANALYYISTERECVKLLEKNPDLKIAHFNHGMIPPSKSSERRNLAKIGSTYVNMLKFVRGESDDGTLSPYIKEHPFYSEDDWKELCTPTPVSFIDLRGNRVMDDITGKLVNVTEGRRVTAFQPEEYDNTIYIVGRCVVFGIYCSDEETFCSQLQKKLNEGFGVNRYRVINLGQFCGSNEIMFRRVISSIDSKPGDIVLIDTRKHKNTKAAFPSIIYEDSDLPDESYGYLFADSGHYSANGHKWVADSLYDALVKNDFYRNETYDKVTDTTKPIPLAGVTSDYGKGFEFPAELQAELDMFKKNIRVAAPRFGAIVMNCNPFTLGHRYLIEYAAQRVNHLFIFAVEEDKSIFSFRDRMDLIKKGTSDLPNVTVLASGKFIISSLTFREYFNKAELQERDIDPSQDVEIFASQIAPALGITVRFAGEEPTDLITRQYNDAMRRQLPKHGIDFVEIPRKEISGEAISASRVRKHLENKNFEAISNLVPKTTLNYLKKHY